MYNMFLSLVCISLYGLKKKDQQISSRPHTQGGRQMSHRCARGTRLQQVLTVNVFRWGKRGKIQDGRCGGKREAFQVFPRG